MQYSKVKSTSKIILPRGEKLESIVLSTMDRIAKIVGSTLGPGGQPILLEHQENLPEHVTKDGVTVFKSLGMRNPIAHSIMNSARDAATRTASEAGDGTTTATVLAEAIVRFSSKFIKKNPRVSPQRVVRAIEHAFKGTIEPTINGWAVKLEGYEQSKKLLTAVATISANGDTDIADAVMKAVDLVGEKGNATIIEISGPSKYEVELIEGFPIGKGFEESCGRYYPVFVTDQAGQRCYLEKPIFILYDGNVSEPSTIVRTLEMIGAQWQNDQNSASNVVLVAHGFSDTLLATLSTNFAAPSTINVFPLVTPQSLIQNSRTTFLYDLQAFTGAKVFDILTKPLSTASIEDFGTGMDYFESYRFRSTVVGTPDSLLVKTKVVELEGQKNNAESILEKTIVEERIGILTGGIARIKVYGASSGELREKRDRTEDAVCSVRGASEQGVLPGGGRTLLDLAHIFFTRGLLGRKRPIEQDEDGILFNILVPALEEPVRVMLRNTGKSEKEIDSILNKLYDNDSLVYDAMNMKFVKPFEAGILDSTPAVLEAIRGSLSIASLLGTLGGCVVYPRDDALDRQDARDVNSFLRDADQFDVNERL